MWSTISQASILVIEDYLPMQKVLEDILKIAGYPEVLLATSVREGLHHLHRANLNLIISDVMLSGMDGLAFYHQVHARERWQHIPFIFLTGNPLELERIRSRLAMEVECCLPKPFPVQDLLDAVAHAVSAARAS